MSQNTAASYTRVSSDSQQSVMAQLERIRRFAEEHGLEVAREFEDKGDSGVTDDRPGFQRMIAAALSPEKALRHHHCLRPFKVFRERLRSHPVQEPAGRGRGQAAERHRTRRVLKHGRHQMETMDYRQRLRKTESS